MERHQDRSHHRVQHRRFRSVDLRAKGGSSKVEGAVWSTAEVNLLPDSSFLLVDDGGTKDGEGKTTPRSLRHLPYRDKDGKVDLAHLRNALARIPQMKTDEATKKRLTEHARQLLEQEGGGSKEKAAMETTTQGEATAKAGAAPAETPFTMAMAKADSILGADAALAKSLGDAVQSVIQSVVVSKTMTPDKVAEAMKASTDLVEQAMSEPDAELRKSALSKAKDLMERLHKSVTAMQPGPQVGMPAGAGGEPWNGSGKPEGDLKPQFTAKAFTAGAGANGNHTIPTAAGGTPPEGAPTSEPKPQVTSFPGGADITNAVRKAAEDLTKALGSLAKAFEPEGGRGAEAARRARGEGGRGAEAGGRGREEGHRRTAGVRRGPGG